MHYLNTDKIQMMLFYFEAFLQWCAGHSGTVHVNPAPYNFVVSQPKWLKFGLQPHVIKMLLHTNFQLSITCTFRVMKLFGKTALLALVPSWRPQPLKKALPKSRGTFFTPEHIWCGLIKLHLKTDCIAFKFTL